MINDATFNALMEDKSFVVDMLSQETAEDVQNLFQKNGVDVSMEEVNELGKVLNHLENSGDELSEESLESISGGFAITGAAVLAVAKAVIAVGGAGLAIYKWYQSR